LEKQVEAYSDMARMKMTVSEWKQFQKNQEKKADSLGTKTSYRPEKSQPQSQKSGWEDVPDAKPWEKEQHRKLPSVGTWAEDPETSNRSQTRSPQKRRGVMGIVGKITGAIKTRQWENAGKKEQANREMLNKKHKFLPQIQRIAKRFGASVDQSDTKAYVYKRVDGRERGVNITYGESDTNIELKLDRLFTQKPLSSKIIRKVTNAAHRAKEIREELGEAGEAIHGAVGDGSGNMFNNPNFGGNFAGAPARASPQKKKKGGSGSPRVSGNGLFPDIKW